MAYSPPPSEFGLSHATVAQIARKHYAHRAHWIAETYGIPEEHVIEWLREADEMGFDTGRPTEVGRSGKITHS